MPDEELLSRYRQLYRQCQGLLEAWDAMQAMNEIAESDDQYGTTLAMQNAIKAVNILVHKRLIPFEDGDTITF